MPWPMLLLSFVRFTSDQPDAVIVVELPPSTVICATRTSLAATQAGRRHDLAARVQDRRRTDPQVRLLPAAEEDDGPVSRQARCQAGRADLPAPGARALPAGNGQVLLDLVRAD